ncbi:glycosyltransferase [Arthrobacter sp. RAF14]|uniref:glycosyltransferase n=1 Tax=Arthrobacter sp. RAF14 TaxID=3233051 RepID=UPI003F8F59AA
MLAEFGEVTTLSYGARPELATSHLEIDASLPSLPQTLKGVLQLGLRMHRAALFEAPAVRAAFEAARGIPFDIIVANEARALPLAHSLADLLSPRPMVWCDLHEWAPEERAHVLSWRLLVKPFMTYVCREFLPKTEAVTVVNGSIGELYRQQFGVSCHVVRNASKYRDIQPSAVQQGTVRLVHSGSAVPGRNLEGMIEAVQLLDESYSLDFYLVGARDGGRYLEQLKGLAKGSERVRFHDAVPPETLSEVLNAYDLGIFSLPPRTKNHELMLPNKFFDFVQARLGIVFSPSPETSRLIDEYHLGAIAADHSPQALADAIRSVGTGQSITELKRNAHEAARFLNSQHDEETEREILRGFSDSLPGHR